MEDKTEVCRANGGFVYSQFLVYAGVGKQISRKMFKNKLIIGNVGIEGSNEIVAVTEGIWNAGIPLAAVGVRIAYPIHPMPCPTFSEVRAFKELIDERLRCFRHILVGCRLERLLLFDRRRKSGNGEG